MITPIHDVFAAANAFDGITYQKGHAVIHMLETYVGDDVFRAGVRNYIAHHAYGNTVTDDLWSEIDKVSPRQDHRHRPRLHPAGRRAADHRRRRAGKACDAHPVAASARTRPSKAPRSWRTPVTVGGLGEPWRTRGQRQGADAQAAPADADPAAERRPGRLFPQPLFAASWQTRIAAAFPTLSPEDQLGLVYDSRALGQAGYAPMSDFLAIAKQRAGRCRTRSS